MMKLAIKTLVGAALIACACVSHAQYWTSSFGNGGYNGARAITKDSAGNVYVTGVFNGTSPDIFVEKISPEGKTQWTISFDVAGWQDAGYYIAGDAQGNVYVAGAAGLSGSVQDTIVIKLDSNANFHWLKQLHPSGTGVDRPGGLAVDVNGGVYVAVRANLFGTQSIYLERLSAVDGLTSWSNLYSFGTAGDLLYGFAADNYGHTYICGTSNGATTSRAFVIKTNGFGGVDWKYFYADPSGHAKGSAVAIDSNNNAIFNGTVNVGSAADMITIALDSHGLFKWKQVYDSSYHDVDVGDAIAIDRDGDIYSAAYSIAGGPLDTESSIVKYSSSGVPLHTWTQNLTSGIEYPSGLCVDKYKRVYLQEVVVFAGSESADTVLTAFDGVSYATVSTNFFGGLGDDEPGGLVADDAGYADIAYTDQLNQSDYAIVAARVPQLPVAVDDSYLVGFNHALIVSAAKGVLSNDTYAGGGITYLLKGPSHGALTLNHDGSFSYQPVAGFFGSDSFQYEPQTNGFYGNTGTVTLTVVPMLASITLPSATITSKGMGSGLVTLNHIAPAGGTQVTLMSSDPSIASVPAFITVPAGQSSIQFTISAGVVTMMQSVKITASYNGNVKTGSVSVGP